MFYILSSRTWKVHPINTTIYEIVKKKNSIVDNELFEMLKVIYKDMEFGTLNRSLMQMELSGLITVSPVMKDNRLIEIRKPQ